ncbi:carboxypeptidase-like regulatory domain-containing protein, partial [Sphingobacterium sp.]|uniref:carboxypeptidase-like regulatory domain-containing protein n=1 Tax=Sphingobacterium sp. TaxID=341027 RepID=UPI00289951C8
MKNNISIIASTVLFSCLTHMASAQTRTVTGRITNEQGLPIVATITVQGNTKIGTSSNENGEFTLAIPTNSNYVVISSLEYEAKTVPITGATLTIQLTQKKGNFNLDEVVVVGYGTQRKGDLTAPIGTVNMEE